MNSFNAFDYAVFVAYACLIMAVGLIVSRKKGGKKRIPRIIF